jgi:CRISPR-associated exonuclease Cas4
MSIPEESWIPISALNHFDYCPRRCYYIHVEQCFLDNAYTVAGQVVHQKAHTDADDGPSHHKIYRNLYLFSHYFGLSGRSDVVEIIESDVIPVEYKSGKDGKWINDRLQLCAQALCLEEMLGQTVSHGFIFYHGTRRRRKVLFDEQIRELTAHTITQCREMLSTGKRPNASFSARCEGCSMYPICLPREMDLLKNPLCPS